MLRLNTVHDKIMATEVNDAFPQRDREASAPALEGGLTHGTGRGERAEFKVGRRLVVPHESRNRGTAGVGIDATRRWPLPCLRSPASGSIQRSDIGLPKRPASPSVNPPDKEGSNKPFGRRFPERKSAAARILATNLRRLRKTQGLSQKDVVDALKTDQAAISLIETGRATLPC
ncbi:XRE family transcriptional regulator [Bradyrhizobium elkanii]|nr:helix-turn-helix transcriptional regulator [Bradyrhizobium elkanii]NWL74974.1 helix-turn-helix transcriptional regulator [Bradyrhizobium elkanii]